MIWVVNRGVLVFFCHTSIEFPFLLNCKGLPRFLDSPTLPLLLDLIRHQRPAQQGHSILLKHCRDLLSIRAGGPTDRS